MRDTRRDAASPARSSKPYCRRGDIDLRGVALYIKADASDQRSSLDTMADIDEIIGNFSILDDWDDRYRYLIELGRELPLLAETARSDANKVQGCASQVWLDTTVRPNGASGPVLTFAGDSDAHIVRGLIAILFAVYSGKSARQILNTDAVKLFEGMGLREHLTPQRSNGFRSMVERIRTDARAALAAAA
jgi:cysteine desulfuration protein SufE